MSFSEVREGGSWLAPAWDYSPNQGYYDEFVAERGEPRPHWLALMAALEESGPETLAQRWQEGQRLIRENGVTYNVYGDPHGEHRPWPLDPIPLIVSQQEWDGIEAAVIQRATILNSVLADLYGPQRLLEDRKLPRNSSSRTQAS